MAFAVAVLLPSSVGAGSYSLVDLGELAQGGTLVVRGINDADDIAGSAIIADGQRAFVLNRIRLRSVHPTPTSDYSVAYAINNNGVVVGSENGPTGVRAFLLAPGLPAMNLPPLAGDSGSEAFAVNASGQAVGLSAGPLGSRAVRWNSSGIPQALAALQQANDSRALTINASGVAAGVSGGQAVVWSSTGVQSLVPLAGDARSEALGINAGGQIVGSSGEPARRRAVLWSPGAGGVDLGVLTGGGSSRAVAINDVGQIVGTSESLLGSRAVMWSGTSGLQDLNDLVSDGTGIVLTYAAAINNRGTIVALGREDTGEGVAHDHDLREHAVRIFLLLPQP